MSECPKRLIVGITGGSGVQLGLRLLQVLSELSWESELVVSATGRAVFAHET
ncbi:MAG: aromatic acid decarboxylase, partial [bacterium]|nr:aromatic acid decarboxylase [bacterium]